MRCIYPEPSPIADLDELVAAQPRPAPAGRPWLLVNMIASLDGAVTVEGRSGGLAGSADKAMFSALRGIGDVVLAGAGTIRAERYGTPRAADATTAARRARGQTDAPRLAIASRSLDLDVTLPLFSEASTPPFVLTCSSAPSDRLRALRTVAEVIVAGDATVDLPAALSELASHGVGTITCEGGPHLNGDLLLADVIDEWALTVSPVLVGGDARRCTTGALPAAPRPMHLDCLLEEDGVLLSRWLRDR